jgi:hypothetical protein
MERHSGNGSKPNANKLHRRKSIVRIVFKGWLCLRCL